MHTITSTSISIEGISTVTTACVATQSIQADLITPVSSQHAFIII